MMHPMLKMEEVSDEMYRVRDLYIDAFSRKRLWLFDLEATGLDTTRERVTQIAGIMLEGGRIVEDSAWAQFVYPGEGVEIPKVVQDLTGITLETLEGAPPFPEAWAAHLGAAEGADIWMGQSVFEFDVPLLFAEFERHGMRAELPATLDSVVVATALLGLTEERWSTSRLISHFEVDVSGLRRHDALDDVKILSRILLPMLEQIRTERDDRLWIPEDDPVDVKRHAPVRS